MGTVGLSFGSPTSGAGFDVSTTVSAIVANLQNVETPWKTQLTKLESQDTAISSLGTLFSNLSNDLSSLTDFQGIIAQKEGSSSDQNVLTLTAANASAVAGTHTVQVRNLAQTSSGYLAVVPSATTPLTGSITLQTGSGTPQTIALDSSDNTLTGLEGAINASGAGVTASILTDASGSRLTLVSGTSGAAGDVTVTANSLGQALGYTAAANSGSQNSTGTFTSVAASTDTLSGSFSVQIGSGQTENVVIGAAPSSPAANTIYTGSGVNTLSGIAGAITAAGIGVTAAAVTNSDGTATLSLTSGTSGSAGTLAVNSSLVDTTTSAMGYTSSVTGADATLWVDGVKTTSASNTVANAISGVTFQLLAPSTTESDNSLEQVQVVIANDNTGVESTFATMVSDYNSLISAVNTQEGLDSSNNAEPLFGSPTLSLLQHQLLSGLNQQNPNGVLDPVADNTDTTLAGAMSITVAGGFSLGYNSTLGSDTVTSTGTVGSIAKASDTLTGSISIQVGSGAAQTVTVGSTSNTLNTLSNAINSANIGVTAWVTKNSDGSSSLSLLSGTLGAAGTLTVNSSILDTSPQTVTLNSTDNTISGLASAINAANIGVSANVVTSNGESSLSLNSQTAGTAGALAVNSSIKATSATPLTYGNTNPYTSTTPDGGLIGGYAGNDVLSGSVIVQVGSGAATTIPVPSSPATLAGLAGAINAAKLGVTATPIEASNGGWSISFTSGTNGSAGALSITSNLLDTTNTTTSTLKYTNSSDINSLTSLGISVNNDGTIALDTASLDSVLNADYSGVVGFFQNANGWGQNFSTMLTNSGKSSSTGILSLASASNSNVESTLNADVSKEQSLISAQQTSLTAELNSANQIMQELPTQLQGVNELYSAITGYNQQTNG
jgi:flagellar hook-associated protein 2